MSRKSRTTLSVVEKLIEQRRLFADWIAKLEAGVDGMPAHVVERVRNDYRARLESVTAELAEHHDALQEALTEAQARHDDLATQQQARKDELAELRLRKHVGELDDQRFKEQSAELKAALDSLSRELAGSLRDIERYEEILEVLTAPEQPEPEEAEPPPVQAEDVGAATPAAAAEAIEESAPPAEQEEAGRGVAADAADDREAGRRAAARVGAAAAGQEAPDAGEAPRREGRGRASRVEPREPGEREPPREADRPAAAAAKSKPHLDPREELEFLRSVTGTTTSRRAKPEPKERAEPSGSAEPAPPAREPRAAPEALEAGAGDEPAPELDAAPNFVTLDPEVAETPPAAEAAGTRADEAAQKTIMCKECGAPNLPTEWYCEKCGAELSAF
jgi:hypothetical protein